MGPRSAQPCTGHFDDINSFAISSDGFFIATASRDKTVRLWCTMSHKRIGQLLTHTADVRCVAISSSGEQLASGDWNGNLQLWSIENILFAAFGMDSSYDFYFVHRSKVKLGQNLYEGASLNADKVIELNPSSHIGYELKYEALRGAQRYDDAFEAFTVMLSKLDDAPDPGIRQLRQQYVSPSEVEDAFQRAIHAQLENAPLRLINTSTGRLCNRDTQINTFTESTEYKELLHSLVMHAPLQMEVIKEAVIKRFSWVMLSHRNSESLVTRGITGQLQQSVNSMFVWYHYSALTIVYLSDVPPLSESGALASSIWNTRGWTVQEFLAPKIVLFYQADWTLYLNTRSRNHKESVSIMGELERSTGINARALVDFHPGTRDAREKLRWASNRDTTREEDIAYSLFGIFDVNLPVIYEEKRQKALGRLLQEIIAHSGDITSLDWVGQSSSFNSCLPAANSSYKALSYTLPSLSEYEMQISVSMLRNNIVAVESASKLYTTLENLSVPRFANARLQLPCIAFSLTEVKRRVGTPCTYHIKADGLQDLEITTADTLIQFWPGRPTLQKFLLIRPWNRHDLGLPDFTDKMQGADDRPEPGSPSDDPLDLSPSDNEPAGSQSLVRESSLLARLGQRLGAFWLGKQDSRSHTRELRLVVRLRQPFSALLLAQQRGGEYKRIASDNEIIAQVRDIASAVDMMDIRTVEIL
ncbi:uncharacterized protein BJ212DRAFT_1585854 [Suillus subaureus]|uniref:Uncharacterized protein n=1 Tax=Suillus subaureus TaxID=48587 RepID=A0A9P7EIG2_9AGAM|nr:uncharacterized protein BJ212DRAFT_1585854 [Suillus subaureus]KAG1821968.1 hypothetical protein BJ212DRAFT_1585854 [Suillus subaureus]